MADLDSGQDAEFQHELDIIKHHVNYKPPGPGDDPEWRCYPELPTAQELSPDWNDKEQVAKTQYLLPNKWQEPWSNKDTYLETHYRLQREEAITMLRYSIRMFAERPRMMDDEETCVYTKVFVQGYLMTRLGPMCRVQFSTERSGKRIRWTQTRRLTTGSLVALSTAQDGFKTICMPAIIADHPIRDGLDQNPPTIQLHWAYSKDAVMDPLAELVMVEARSGYFEAVRHNMVGLQHVAVTETPLDKYLVQADKSDLTADYVVKNPEMNISSLVHHLPDSTEIEEAEIREQLAKVREPLTSISVIDGISNKMSPYTNLDNSQLSAVHRILTKELAIVQGPPGTGKTYTSVQALRILLDSQDRGSHVVVVAAQTNHAVDQILIQLIQLGYNVVRLGGRTQNEDIKRYNMYNLRRRALPSSAQRGDRDYKACEAARRRNIASLEGIVGDIFPQGLIDPIRLCESGIITKQQLESLGRGDEWAIAPSSGQPTDLFCEWLGEQLVEAPPLSFREPVFDTPEDDDTVDLDVEDYDVELDDCIADDDADRGRIEGRWVPIHPTWVGANPENLNDRDLTIRREMRRSNLWGIEKKYRGAIYQQWQRELLRRSSQGFQDILAENARICKNLKINRWYKDTQVIKSAKVEIIGCTTTGLCKYRGLLAALQPRTMLVEEAAETREANIMSALYGSLQQLILVGDHQQLAPHCDIPYLAGEPYCLRVSMFERLVKLDMPFTVLNMQRRMIPILREVLNPFYPGLQDHPVVEKKDARPPIPGMSVESYFFHHTWSEGTDENLSKFNIMEAEMVVRFINYLLMNGVDAQQITVLTFYRGQKKKIANEAKSKLRNRVPFTNIHTVDSYQGEESDIVILSLVRSNGPNGPHKAGFLRDMNRGVVAISRARRGFYIFGNMTNLAYACDESWQMWGAVQRVFESQDRFGSKTLLPIVCQKHGMCSVFTGAYVHDEDVSFETQRGLEFDQAEVFPSTNRRRGRAGVRSRGGHNGYQGRPGPRGGVGLGYGQGNLGDFPVLSRELDGNSLRLAHHRDTAWGDYDARRDDAQRLHASRLQGTGELVDASDPFAQSPRPNKNIRETYRPVNLNNGGKRNVGEGLVSNSSDEPSPTKGASSAVPKGPRPAQNDGTQHEDLLDLNAPVHTQALTLPTRPSTSNRPRTATEEFINPGQLDGEIVASTPARASRASDLQSGVVQSHPRPSMHSNASMLSQPQPDQYTTAALSNRGTGWFHLPLAAQTFPPATGVEGESDHPNQLGWTSADSLRYSGQNNFTNGAQQYLPRIRSTGQAVESLVPAPRSQLTPSPRMEPEDAEWENVSTTDGGNGVDDHDDVFGNGEEDLINF